MQKDRRYLIQKVCFFIGAFAGVLLVNQIWKAGESQKEIWECKWVIEVFQKKIPVWSHMEKIFLFRSSIMLVCIWILKVGRGSILGLFFLIVEAMRIGGTVTLSILQLGFLGGVWGIAMLFPQDLFYVYAYHLVAEGFCTNVRKSIMIRRFLLGKRGKNQKLCLAVAMLYMMGLVTEILLNPWLLKELAKIIKIY